MKIYIWEPVCLSNHDSLSKKLNDFLVAFLTPNTIFISNDIPFYSCIHRSYQVIIFHGIRKDISILRHVIRPWSNSTYVCWLNGLDFRWGPDLHFPRDLYLRLKR